jgi:hypothetical protein
VGPGLSASVVTLEIHGFGWVRSIPLPASAGAGSTLKTKPSAVPLNMLCKWMVPASRKLGFDHVEA